MTYKLKHLSKYCCKPETETEFEAVKMAAELGGVGWFEENCYPDELFPYLSAYVLDGFVSGDSSGVVKRKDEIPVLEFCRKLRMTEEEAQALEADMVEFEACHVDKKWRWKDNFTLEAMDGHHLRLSEDAKECYLVKDNPTK